MGKPGPKKRATAANAKARQRRKQAARVAAPASSVPASGASKKSSRGDSARGASSCGLCSKKLKDDGETAKSKYSDAPANACLSCYTNYLPNVKNVSWDHLCKASQGRQDIIDTLNDPSNGACGRGEEVGEDDMLEVPFSLIRASIPPIEVESTIVGCGDARVAM